MKSIVKCAECRWWGDDESVWIQNGVGARFCQNPMVCQPYYGERNNLTMRSDGVLTCDEGGCTGELITGPSFGCIHGEATTIPPKDIPPSDHRGSVAGSEYERLFLECSRYRNALDSILNFNQHTPVNFSGITCFSQTQIAAVSLMQNDHPSVIAGKLLSSKTH